MDSSQPLAPHPTYTACLSSVITKNKLKMQTDPVDGMKATIHVTTWENSDRHADKR
jgi:hypothetical protein